MDKKRKVGQRGKGKNPKYKAVERAAAIAEILPPVDVIPSEPLPKGVLPDNLPDIIQNNINSFCDYQNIDDLRTASAQEWSAVCMYIGRTMFKNSKILHDTERERERGCTVYDAEKISSLCDIWAALCAVYSKPPLIFDFCFFSGVSRQYIWGNNGDGVVLTSAAVRLRQKLQMYQEGGITSRLVDGRGSQVGQIFFLKNWHGWKDERTITHETNDRGQEKAAELPTFGDIPAIEDKNG